MCVEKKRGGGVELHIGLELISVLLVLKLFFLDFKKFRIIFLCTKSLSQILLATCTCN